MDRTLVVRLGSKHLYNTEPSPWLTDPSKSQLSRKPYKERISASLHYGNLEIKGQKMKLGNVKSDGSLQTDFI